MSNRKGLCVGVNKFKNLASSNWLQGCVADANAMAGVYTNTALGLGFVPGDITTLTDTNATKANIISNLKTMVAGAKAGKLSYLMFSFSSHGTQVPDVNGDEPDRYDEAICPYDLKQKGNQWDANTIVVDDELCDLFAQVPANVLVEIYLDTCHSGTGLKGIDLLLDRKPRYLPPPTAKGLAQLAELQPRSIGRVKLQKGLNHQILWAACRADQTSSDANIGGGWHGAFTYFFCKEITACKNKLSRSAVLTKVRADLAAGHYSQIPQLECDATGRGIKGGLA